MPRRLNRDEAESLVRNLQALSKAQSLYPAGHAAVGRAQAALESMLSTVFFSSRVPLLVGLTDGYLVVGNYPFVDENPHARDLVSRLEGRGIEGVLLEPGVSTEEVEHFLGWLRTVPPSPWHGDRITLTLLDKSGSHWKRALKLHGAAVQALQEADRDLREGRLPNPDKVKECVAAFSDLLEEKPSILPGLLLIKDYDNYTFYHSVNVSLLSLGIGRQLGLDGRALEHLGVGGLMHDIGKTKTPVDVIRKPGRLSTDEFDLIRWHPVHGRDILSQMEAFPEAVVRVVYEHHMGFDGSGYPTPDPGLGVLHPLTALVTTADIYDAMTTQRPYQGPMSPPAAVSAMKELRGTHLAPPVFDAFLSLLGTMPVGSLLRLRTGEVAVATRIGRGGSVDEVLLVAGMDGKELPAADRIAREVEPGDVAGWVGTAPRQVDVLEAVKSRI